MTDELNASLWSESIRALPTGSGIYAIWNTVTGGVYIGRSTGIRRRHADHRKVLRAGRSANVVLQQAYTKYGENAFRSVALELVPEQFLGAAEVWWFDHSPHEYNCARPDEDGGGDVSEERRKELGWREFDFLTRTNEVTHVVNLSAFCREHDLDLTTMWWVGTGLANKRGAHVYNHRGYRRYVSGEPPIPLGWRRNQKLSQEIADTIRQEYATGTSSQNKLAAKYGVTQGMIKAIVLNEAYTRSGLPAAVRRGTGHKLNAQQAQEIRERYAAGGITQKQLAAEYGVGPKPISRIVRGLAWKPSQPDAQSTVPDGPPQQPDGATTSADDPPDDEPDPTAA